MKRGLWLLVAVMTFSACRKRPDPVVVPNTDTTHGSHTHDTTKVDTVRTLKIGFEGMVGDRPLVFGSEIYKNANGDSFTISKYRYYISNVKLIAADGKIYSEPESYYLIDHKHDTSSSFTLKGVPEGAYNKITFLIGVDSLRNVSGAQSGPLDPIHGMFWDWNTGYIMAMMEGKVLDGTAQGKVLGLHIAGFDQSSSVLKTVTLTLPQPVVVNKEKKAAVYIKSDAAEWFKNPSVIDFRKTSLIMKTGFNAQIIAENYADMFTVDRTE
jgi:hypothetical protein